MDTFGSGSPEPSKKPGARIGLAGIGIGCLIGALLIGVAVLGGGGGDAPIDTPTSATAGESDEPYDVFVGYADGNSDGVGKLPSPWRDDPDVVFIGKDDTNCCVAENDKPGWDGGAIRVQNNTEDPMTVHIEVTGMELCDRDWPESIVGAGENLIVTNTRNEGPESGNAEYWDTSDSEWLCLGVAMGATNCGYSPTGIIDVTVDGETARFFDTALVFLAKGNDSTCDNVETEGYEFVEWERPARSG